MRFYRLAAKQGYASAMYILAKSLIDGSGCEMDLVLAVPKMRRAVELDHSEAQNELGMWYSLGEGSPLPVNYKVMMRLTRLAAHKGDATAISNLGVFIANGQGVPRDLDEACRLYSRAIELGFEPAKDKLRRLAWQGHTPSLAAVRELRLAPL